MLNDAEKIRAMTEDQFEAYIEEHANKTKEVMKKMCELDDVGITGIIFVSLRRLCDGESKAVRDLWIKASRLACQDKMDDAAEATTQAEKLMSETVAAKIAAN